MTVKELIEKLQEFDGDNKVLGWDSLNFEAYDISIEEYADDPRAVLIYNKKYDV